MVVNALAGYAFQKVFAYYYGASVEKSIFDIAFSVPTMLVYLSGLGQAYAVIVSLFSRLREERKQDLDAIFSTLTNLSFIALLAVVVITAVFSGALSSLLGPGFDESQRAATQSQILWLLPLAIVFGLSSHLSAVAIAWRVPIGQEMVLLVARATVIVALVIHGKAMPLNRVAEILIVSTVMALIMQWLLLRSLTGLKYAFACNLRDRDIRLAIRQLGGLLLVSVAAQIASAYCRRMGTIAGPAVVALIGFAYSIMDAVASIVGKTFSFQIGQPLAAKLRSAKLAKRSFSAGSAVLIALVTGIACSTVLLLFNEWIVGLLFGGGAFDDAAIVETARYLGILAIGLPGALIVWVCLYPLLEVSKHCAAVTYLAGFLVQIVWLALSFDALSASAIAWSYTVCLWTQAVVAWAAVSLYSRPKKG
jgi:peptidoglycan biosynthesis protein MviN/MurJ (putative lipid II flippase)